MCIVVCFNATYRPLYTIYIYTYPTHRLTLATVTWYITLYTGASVSGLAGASDPGSAFSPRANAPYYVRLAIMKLKRKQRSLPTICVGGCASKRQCVYIRQMILSENPLLHIYCICTHARRVVSITGIGINMYNINETRSCVCIYMHVYRNRMKQRHCY